MLVSVIIIAALLFVLALAVLMDACRPTMSLGIERDPAVDRGLVATGNTPRHRRLGCGLSEEDRDGFCQVWHSVREEFASDPNAAVRRADLLLLDLIEDCNGPMAEGEEPERVFAGPDLEQQFWRAHEIALRTRKGAAQAAELDRAIRLYGHLFERLLESEEDANPVAGKR